jgi:hypothetical protein
MNGIIKNAAFPIALLSLSLAACEGWDVGDPIDPGIEDPGRDDGGGDNPDLENAELKWVVIFDDSNEDYGTGTAGADICGVVARCDGQRLTGVQSLYEAGAGDICNRSGPGCQADRGNPEAALDDGESCSPDSVPSDYLSLGLGGELGINFNRDLRGCNVTVREYDGADPERVEVYVCNTGAITADSLCVNANMPLSAGEGTLSFTVPAQ